MRLGDFDLAPRWARRCWQLFCLSTTVLCRSTATRLCMMGWTLRRACSSCAKTKQRCDLGTPRCTRCINRKIECIHMNKPSTALSPIDRSRIYPVTTIAQDNAIRHGQSMVCDSLAELDPFDSLPPTRLDKKYARRLIAICTSLSNRHYYGSSIKSSSS